MRKKILPFTVFLLLHCNAFCQLQIQYNSPPCNTDIAVSASWWSSADVPAPDQAAAVSVINGVDAQILSSASVTLLPGFTASSFGGNAGCHSFRAAIQPLMLDGFLVAPDASHVDQLGNVSVEKWEKYELAFKLPPAYEQAVAGFLDHYYNGGVDPNADLNPYADDSLEVRIDLVSPTGRHLTKWAFFMREAEWNGTNDASILQEATNTLADYHWHFRFAPDEEGAWFYSITVSTPKWAVPLPAYTYGEFHFNCTSPLYDNHGYLRVAENNQFLRFDDSTPFFALGENLNGGRGYWGGNSKWPPNCDYNFYHLTFDLYKKTFDEMKDVGANFARITMLRNNFSFDRDHLGVYDEYSNQIPFPNCTTTAIQCNSNTDAGNRQYNLWVLDQLFDKAREDNVYLQFLVDYETPHKAYQSFHWGDNAYVRYLEQVYDYNTNGYVNFGLDYYSDQTLRYYFKRKYKYFFSRFGYSVNLGIIQPLNEIDGSFGFNSAFELAASNCDPINSGNVTFVPDLKNSIDSWLTDVIGNIKAPASEGGTEDKNHLFELTYLGLPGLNISDYNNDFDDYYSLFGNIKIDLMGISSYFEQQNQMEIRKNFSTDVTNAFPQKPLRLTEGNCMGGIHLGPDDDKNTAFYYNNYDISFHNELWASAFMGTTGTMNTWIGEVVHRWPYATPAGHQEGDDIEIDVNLLGSTQHISEKCSSFYHNYKPLSGFMSMIDFSQNYFSEKYFNTTTFIESYYLKSADQNNAWGWVHNINKYWAYNYYFEDDQQIQYDHFFGCENLQQPPAANFTITGFNPNQTYYIYFFPTRMNGQTLPSSATLFSSSSGELTIDLSSSTLGCDSINADYAYYISDVEHTWDNTRMANPNTSVTESSDAQIIPNPSTGIFTISLTGSFAVQSSVEVRDFTGKLVYERNVLNTSNLDLNLSTYSKGVYFVKVISNLSAIIKQVIVL